MIRNEEFYAVVGRRIRDVRQGKRPRLTQDGLAKLVGLTRTSITNIEQGRQKCLLHTLAEIAAALNVDPAALFPTTVPSIAELRHALVHRSAPEKDWIMSAVAAAASGKVKHGS